MSRNEGFGLAVVGAGPAGLGPLFAAASEGKLRELLSRGVIVIESSDTPGRGALGNYLIHSDSSAEAFLNIVMGSQEAKLQELRTHPTTLALLAAAANTVPLRLAAEFLELAGRAMWELVREAPGCEVLTGTTVDSVQQKPDGSFLLHARGKSTLDSRVIVARSVLLATGATQPIERLRNEPVAGLPLLPLYDGKVIQSGELFTEYGTERVARLLKTTSDPRIVIVGGSTSAGSSAVHLLKNFSALLGDTPGAVTLMHRRTLRLFYSSAEEALADGYSDFTERDVCPISKRIYRLSGFRFESKELLKGLLGVGTSTADSRVQLFRLEDNFEEAQALLQTADLIISAIGYRPRLIPFFDEDGCATELFNPSTGDWAVVDQRCRVLRSDRTSIDGLFAMGLSVGPGASRDLGGEENFTGQINSLWLWQNSLGSRIVGNVLERMNESGAQDLSVKRYLNEVSLPVVRPTPPALSKHARELAQVESSGIYSNYGPVNTRFEQDLVRTIFQSGACLTTCNATTALMIAIKDAVGDQSKKRYALMPSFTFAAAAQAALWCGLTPLFCDIDPETWLPSARSEETLLRRYADQIAVIIPVTTFGNNLDLGRYNALAEKYEVPIVVDAAASLGSVDEAGNAFGSGSPWPIIFSMHATKPFSVGEGGIIYSADTDRIRRLRAMASFGFGAPRTATMLGLNGKLSEVAALTASLKLRDFHQSVEHRQHLSEIYQRELGITFAMQKTCGMRQAKTFESILLPVSPKVDRAVVSQRMSALGIGSATYFSPHLAEQPYIRSRSEAGLLRVTADVASRILTLPLLDSMTEEDVALVATRLHETVDGLAGSTARDYSRFIPERLVS